MKNFYLTTVVTMVMAISVFCAEVVQYERSVPEQTRLTNTPTNWTCPPTGFKRIPYPGDRTKYITCNNGVGTPGQCLEGHYFNPNIGIGECDLIPGGNGTDRDCPAEHCEGILRLPYTGDCSSYWECVNGKKVKKTCREGLKFDKVTQMCDFERYVDCGDNEYICTNDTPNNAKVPHDCDCRLYYICKNGQSVRQECPSGKKYDYIKKDCVLADLAQCYKQYKSKTLDLALFSTCYD